MAQRKINPVADGVVTVSPRIMSGVPVFTGTRVPVKTLFDHLAAGDSLDDFFEDFPDVTFEQVSTLLKQVGEGIGARAA